MKTPHLTPVRALLLAAALVFATQAVDANTAPTNHPQTTTARSNGNAGATDRDGVSLDGLLVVAAVVGLVVLLAWVCSRVSDR
jgi:hypothetical protein